MSDQYSDWTQPESQVTFKFFLEIIKTIDYFYLINLIIISPFFLGSTKVFRSRCRGGAHNMAKLYIFRKFRQF